MNVGPGRHPSFDITIYSPEHQRVLRRLESLFHLTRHGRVELGATSEYLYALAKPTERVRRLVHTEREVVVAFSPYREFQPRTLDAFESVFVENEEFRIEKIVRVLVSDDVHVATKLKSLLQSRPDAPVVVPFHPSELTLATPDEAIFARFREFTFTRDLFSMSSPLRSDLYFYGRSQITNEITTKLSLGENFGLFGLRRSGKTSIVHGVSRAVEARGGKSLIVDCSNPSVHQRRWNELLYWIADNFRRSHATAATIHAEQKYDTKDAATHFVNDMRVMKGRSGAEFTALLFDEIERISYGTASSSHWNDDRDFLLFWQAVRAGFQSDAPPYTFLVVGTNPSTIERIKIQESDNPLFGNVERRFIPMFTAQQVSEMVTDLGTVMGVEFDELAKARLFEDFGGHPFLTRYACSHIASHNTKRPLSVDRTVYANGIIKFKNEANEYVKSIVEMVSELFPDEFAMLKMLAVEKRSDFESLAIADPALVEHLIGYGMVMQGEEGHYFRLGVVEGYFEREARPVELLNQEARRSELSNKRNRVEQTLRQVVRQAFQLSFPASKRVGELLKSLPEARRASLASEAFENIINPTNSPLYLLDLDGVLNANWSLFQHVINLSKDEVRHHIKVANQLRRDAHANDIDDDQFEKARVSLRELERALTLDV